MKRGMRKTAAACCIALLLLSGCGKTAGNVNSDTADSSAVTEQSDSEESAASQSDTDDIDSMFTDRDKEVVMMRRNVWLLLCQMMAAVVTIHQLP